MSDDIERRLRQALEDEVRGAPAPHASAGTIRRVRRRQTATVAGGLVGVVALVVAGAVGVGALRGDDGGIPAARPTLTDELNGITITYPEGWALVDPDEAGLNGGLPEGEDPLPRLLLMLAPTPPDESFGCPEVVETIDPITFLMSVQQRPLSLSGPRSAPWPADPVEMANGPTEGGCYGGWEFLQAEFTAAGRSFDVRVGFSPEAADADREALLEAYASMTFAASTGPEAVVLASGFAGDEEWELIAERGESGLELSVDATSSGSGTGGFEDTEARVHVSSIDVGGRPEGATIVYGAVTDDVARLEIEVSTVPGVAEPVDVLDIPDDIDPDLEAFVATLPIGSAGEVRALDAAGEVVGFGSYGEIASCPETPVSSGAGDGRAIASEEEATSAVRNALAAARTAVSDCPDYRMLTPDVIDAVEPTYAYDDATVVSTSVVSVRPVTAGALILVTRAEDGSLRCLADDAETGRVTYGTQDATVLEECTGGWPGEPGTA